MKEGKIAKEVMDKIKDHLKEKYFSGNSIPLIDIMDIKDGLDKSLSCLKADFDNNKKAFRENFEFVLENSRSKNNSFDRNNPLLYSFKYVLKEISGEELFLKYLKKRSKLAQEKINRGVNNLQKLFLNWATNEYDEDDEIEKRVQMHNGIKHAAKCLKLMLSKHNVHKSSLELALQQFKDSKITKGDPYFVGFRAMMYEYDKMSFYNKFEEEVGKLNTW